MLIRRISCELLLWFSGYSSSMVPQAKLSMSKISCYGIIVSLLLMNAWYIFGVRNQKYQIGRVFYEGGHNTEYINITHSPRYGKLHKIRHQRLLSISLDTKGDYGECDYIFMLRDYPNLEQHI